MKRILLSLFIIACSPVIKAQIYDLSLDESIEIAKERSYGMQSLLKDLEKADYNLKATTSRLKTKVSLDLTLPDYTETMNEFEDSTGVYYFPVKMLRSYGNLQINQPLPTDGRIFVEGGLSTINDYNASLRSTNFNTRIGFSQPINSLYGYNTIKSDLKRAKLEYEGMQKQLKRAELDLVYIVSAQYYNLLSLQKGADIALMVLEKQADAYEISKNKYAAGLIREVEALQMEVDLAAANNNYDIAMLSQVEATNSFKELIGLNLTDSVKLRSELRYDVVNVDPEKAVQSALENRLEIREMEIQMELQRLSVKRQKAEGLPKINLNGYYQRVGVNREGLSTGFTNSIYSSWLDFARRPSNFGVGLTVRIPIFDWGQNKAMVRSFESDLQKTEINKEDEERKIETEVRNLVSNLSSNLMRLKLLEKNVAIAEKSFEITHKRFSDGNIDSQALALERERLNSAYTSHLSVYIAYQLSLVDLTRKTFYDFVHDVPIE